MLVDLLGQSLLERAITKLREFGVVKPCVISEGMGSNQVLPSRSANTSGFIAAWESAVASRMQHGVDLLLLIRMSTYTDLKYSELLQVHLDRQSALTQVYGADGPLDIALVDASFLRDAGSAYRKALSGLVAQEQRFLYGGYVNRLNTPQDFRTLVEDGLRGNCGLYPVGIEVQPQVWHGHGAEVDGSAVVGAPAFVGARSHVAASCTLTGVSAIERGCKIDYGTMIDQSCILQDSYIGMGLDVRRSIVIDKTVFHLERNVEVSIGDRRLIGVNSGKPLPSLPKTAPFVMNEI
jgi:carbonic anhydrase/acetyltransferase-like protein (isoleucine patch superfamily)